jgi:hypothetical protein
MAQARHIRRWTNQEVDALRQLVKENTPAQLIAVKLGRSVTSIYKKAKREGISLKLTNRK